MPASRPGPASKDRYSLARPLSLERFRSVFAAYDMNGDGKISRAEAKAGGMGDSRFLSTTSIATELSAPTSSISATARASAGAGRPWRLQCRSGSPRSSASPRSAGGAFRRRRSRRAQSLRAPIPTKHRPRSPPMISAAAATAGRRLPRGPNPTINRFRGRTQESPRHPARWRRGPEPGRHGLATRRPPLTLGKRRGAPGSRISDPGGPPGIPMILVPSYPCRVRFLM